MSTALHHITAEQLAALPDDGRRYELVRGELRMMSPAGSEHGRIAANVLLSVAQHVKQKKLGTVYAAETGFLLGTGPDTVRAPDVAFVRKERLDELGPVAGYLPLAPDFVAEVVSPKDSYSQVEEKALAWIEAGVRMVLVVDPVTRTVQVYRSAHNMVSLNCEQRLDAADVVSGWNVPVADFFEV
jgi:Uma2 family endonuclease